MPSQSRIDMVINTIFNQKGFKQAKFAMEGLAKEAKNMNSAISSTKTIAFQKNQQKLLKDAGVTQTDISKDYGASVKKISSFLEEQTAEQEKLNIANKKFGDIRKAKNFAALQKEAAGAGFALKQTGEISKVVGNQLVKATPVQLGTALESVSAKTRELKNAPRGLADRFSMEFLGIMFAGMAIQRVMTGIMRSSVMTFTKIMQESKIGGTAVSQLTTEFTYLKFSLGMAFDEFIKKNPFILEFVQMLARMSGKYPEEVAKGIISIATAGTVFFIGGQFMLGLTSFMMFLKELKAGGYAEILGSVGKNLSFLQTLAGTYGIIFNIVGAYQDFKDDKYLSGIASAFGAGSFLALMMNKSKLGGALIVGSIGLELASVLTGEQEFSKALDDILTNLAIYGVMTGNPILSVSAVLTKFLLAENFITSLENILDSISTAINNYFDEHPVLGAIFKGLFTAGEDINVGEGLIGTARALQEGVSGLDQMQEDVAWKKTPTGKLLGGMRPEIISPDMQTGVTELTKNLDTLRNQSVSPLFTELGTLQTGIEGEDGLKQSFLTLGTQINQDSENFGGTLNSLNDSTVVLNDNFVAGGETLAVMTSTTIPENIIIQGEHQTALNDSATAANNLANALDRVNDETERARELADKGASNGISGTIREFLS